MKTNIKKIISGVTLGFLLMSTQSYAAQDGSIGEAFINDGSEWILKGERITGESIVSEQIKNDTVRSEDIKNQTVQQIDMADNSIGSDQIIDGSIGGADIANNSIGSDQIINGSILSEDIGDGEVKSGNIGDKAVKNNHLDDNAVDSRSIKNGSIEGSDIGRQQITGFNIAPGAITESKIGSGAVSTGKIQNGAIISEKIKDGAVVDGKIGIGAVGTDQLKNGAITEEKIDEGAVSTRTIAKNAITSEKINDGAVIGSKIGNGEITSRHISPDGLDLPGNMGFGTGASDDYTINIGGDVNMNNNDIDNVKNLNFNGGVDVLGIGSELLEVKYGDDSDGGIVIKNGLGEAQGYVYASKDGNSFGLKDKDKDWAVRIDHDNYVEISNDGKGELIIGIEGVTGDVGTVQTLPSKQVDRWSGYSLNGEYALIGGDTRFFNGIGLYDDIDNEFMLLGGHNGGVQLFYDGKWKMTTTKNGIYVDGGIESKGKLVIESNPTNQNHVGNVGYNDKRYVKIGSTGTVDSRTIKDGSITGKDIGGNTINNNNLADNSVDSRTIKDGSVTGKDIANNAIGNDQMIDDPTFETLKIGKDGSKLHVSKNGNVGIGVVSPTHKLDVDGKIRMRQQTTDSDGDDIVVTKGYLDAKLASLGSGGGNGEYIDTGVLDKKTNNSAEEKTVVANGCYKVDNNAYSAGQWMSCRKGYYFAAHMDHEASQQHLLCCPFKGGNSGGNGNGGGEDGNVGGSATFDTKIKTCKTGGTGKWLNECTVSCDAGYKALGGGCNADSNWSRGEGYPWGTNGWKCSVHEDWGSKAYYKGGTGYVVCGKTTGGNGSGGSTVWDKSGNNIKYDEGNVGIGVKARTDTYKLNMGGDIHMNNMNINYVNQLHFNDNLRFIDEGKNDFLNFKYGNKSGGGLKISDGDNGTQGYIYSAGNNSDFGLKDKDGKWIVNGKRNGPTSLYYGGVPKISTTVKGIDVAGKITSSQSTNDNDPKNTLTTKSYVDSKIAEMSGAIGTSSIGGSSIDYSTCTVKTWQSNNNEQSCPVNQVVVSMNSNGSDSHEWSRFKCCELRSGGLSGTGSGTSLWKQSGNNIEYNNGGVGIGSNPGENTFVIGGTKYVRGQTTDDEGKYPNRCACDIDDKKEDCDGKTIINKSSSLNYCSDYTRKYRIGGSKKAIIYNKVDGTSLIINKAGDISATQGKIKMTNATTDEDSGSTVVTKEYLLKKIAELEARLGKGTSTSGPQAGVCNNSTRNSCTSGTPNDGAVADTSDSYRWRCDGEGDKPSSGPCETKRPVAGVCNNGVRNGCHGGIANDSAVADNVTQYKWRCDGQFEGSNSKTCSRYKAGWYTSPQRVACSTTCGQKGLRSTTDSAGNLCRSIEIGYNGRNTRQYTNKDRYCKGSERGDCYSWGYRDWVNECYSQGQKQDHDSTDQTTACYCG